MIGLGSDKNRKSWIHALILCIIKSRYELPPMCKISPTHPLLPLNVSIYVWGETGEGGEGGDQLTADKPHFILISHWHSMFSS